MVNNAAINPIGSLVETDEATWDRIMGVNLKAVCSPSEMSRQVSWVQVTRARAPH